MAEETIPKKLFDAAIKESVYLDKYSAGLAKDVRKLLDDAQNEIVGAIAKNDPTAPIMTKWKAARLEKLNDDINNILNNTYGEIKKEVNSGLKKVGSVQAKSAVNTINGIVGIDVFDVTLTNSNVQGIVENTMIQGNIIGEWWDKQSDSVKSKLSAQMAEGTKAIQIGLVQGESVGDLISRVRGTALKPGVMSLTKREATALVRTSVMQVANAVRQETYKKNADVLDGIEWCSTLDARTTPLCQAMDGKRYDMELNPIDHDMEYPGGPPAHWQCFIDKQIPIYTSKGWVHIGSIKVGDLVLTHKGRFRKVTEIIRTKKQSPEVVTIGLNGWVKVTMTADHPVMSNGRWRRAGDLKDGDSISFLSHKCGRTECNKIVPHFRKYCSLSCRSLEAGKIPWTKERKTSVSAKISRNMLHQYESGLRDRFAVTQKANKATRKLVKQGKASFQRKWVGDKGRNSQRTSLKWKASILDHMMNRNPMTVPGAKKKMIESNNRRIQAHPEKHPNVVMAQRGFVSSIERKMAELLDALGVAYIQQCPIAGKYVDFAIPDLNIVIEVDGEYWHQNDIADRIRQKKIEDAGWQVFRFGERQIKKDIDGVKAEVVRIACNHAGVYEFADFGIIAVKKWKVLRPKTLYNFSVEEDESYIAKGFVVHNCRSTTIPVLKSWAELLKSKKMSEKQIKVLENMSQGMRDTINGPIPMNMTYNDWLLTQPISLQKEILGPGKWKLWSENKLTVSDLVDNSGLPLTIKELQAKLGISREVTTSFKSYDEDLMPAWGHAPTEEQINKVKMDYEAIPSELRRHNTYREELNVGVINKGAGVSPRSEGQTIWLGESDLKPGGYSGVSQHELRHALISPGIIDAGGGFNKMADILESSKFRLPIHTNFMKLRNGNSRMVFVDEFITQMGDSYSSGLSKVEQIERVMGEKSSKYTIDVSPTDKFATTYTNGVAKWTQEEADAAVTLWRKWVGIK